MADYTGLVERAIKISLQKGILRGLKDLSHQKVIKGRLT